MADSWVIFDCVRLTFDWFDWFDWLSITFNSSPITLSVGPIYAGLNSTLALITTVGTAYSTSIRTGVLATAHTKLKIYERTNRIQLNQLNAIEHNRIQLNVIEAIEWQILGNIQLRFDCVQQSNRNYSIVFNCVQLIWRSIGSIDTVWSIKSIKFWFPNSEATHMKQPI